MEFGGIIAVQRTVAAGNGGAEGLASSKEHKRSDESAGLDEGIILLLLAAPSENQQPWKKKLQKVADVVIRNEVQSQSPILAQE